MSGESISLHNNSFLNQLVSIVMVCRMCKNLALGTQRKEVKQMYVLQTCDSVLGDGRVAYDNGYITKEDFGMIDMLCAKYKFACDKCVINGGKGGVIVELYSGLIRMVLSDDDEEDQGKKVSVLARVK